MTATTINVLIAGAGIVVTVLVAYVTHQISQRRRRPRYVLAGNTVVRGGGVIEVRYQGTVVPQVSRTLVAVWNSGNEPIRSEDVRSPVSVRVADGEILDSQLLAVTRSEIGATLDPVGIDAVAFQFDHLDRDDGAVIEVLHTGANPFNVTVAAVIVGAREGAQRFRSPLWNDPVGPWLALVVGGMSAYVGVTNLGDAPVLGWTLLGVAPLLTAGLLVRTRLRDVRKLPSELRDVRFPSVPWDEWTRAGRKGAGGEAPGS